MGLAATAGVQPARLLGLVGLHRSRLPHPHRPADPGGQGDDRSAGPKTLSNMPAAPPDIEESIRTSSLEVLRAFLKLGLLSFGGPIAHLGYFRDEFVARRKWLKDAEYGDLVALCQFLPGPASSQVGMAIGLR